MQSEPNRDGHVSVNFTVKGGPTEEGRLVVVAEWPDEQDGRVFDRDEAVIFGLYLVQVASKLYSSAEEFAAAVNFARTQVMDLEPIAFQPSNGSGTEERPVL